MISVPAVEVSKIAERSFLIKVLVFEVPANAASHALTVPQFSIDAYDVDSFNGWVWIIINILRIIYVHVFV